MSEFEAATVAYQQASLATTHTAAYVQATVTAIVGFVQAGIVAWGIRIMVRESAKRERHHADRHTEAMATAAQQHEATMLALRTLIERTAPKA